MPKAGDRVIIEGTKIGAGRREGTLVSQIGSLIKIRWDDGAESLLTPGAGTVTYVARAASGGNAGKGAGSTKKPARAVAAAKTSARATGKAGGAKAKAPTAKGTVGKAKKKK